MVFIFYGNREGEMYEIHADREHVLRIEGVVLRVIVQSTQKRRSRLDFPTVALPIISSLCKKSLIRSQTHSLTLVLFRHEGIRT